MACLSGAMDLISPAVVGHHKRVGLAAARLGETMGLDKETVTNLLLAGMVHDAGAFSLRNRLDTLEFDTQESRHAGIGAKLVSGCRHLQPAAPFVRFHHTDHNAPPSATAAREDLLGGQILHVVDRADVAVKKDRDALSQKEEIRGKIASRAGRAFDPEVADAFMELSSDPDYWRDMAAPDLDAIIKWKVDFNNPFLNQDEIMVCSEAFSHIIDFRSRFTATHSKGVAATAQVLSELADSGQLAPDLMALAGNLHDIGKLGVPVEYLDKPGALTKEEFDVVKRHPEHSHSLLSAVPGFERINQWASNHHERPNGQGYPKGMKQEQLDLGSRVMAVADVFTAVTEDRPYRAGMDKDQAIRVLANMGREGALDPGLVELLENHFSLVNLTRINAQHKAQLVFQSMTG